MKYHLVGELPRHLYCFVDSTFVYKEPSIELMIPCVWFGLVSYPGRTWGCTIMLECGAVYRNVPVHALSFVKFPDGEWTPEDAQTWDCYGESFTTLEYTYLSELKCKVRANGQEHDGTYLFTAAPIGDGFSAYPEQAKEFYFIELDNGRLTVQPTNNVVLEERSFTTSTEFPHDLKRQTIVWSCEDK